MSKVAFLYPGQGTQYVGMGKDLYESSEKAKDVFDKIFSGLKLDLKETMFEGPEEKLMSTKYTQPAIVAFSLVLTELLKEKGIKPDFVTGHSLGQYSALGAANFLSFEETVKLAELRGEIMAEVTDEVDGTMAAIIGLDSEKIAQVCELTDGIVEAVNFNEPNQTVIAGNKKSIENACLKLKDAGARRAKILSVSGPFHSSLMKPAGEKLKEKLGNFAFNDGEIKLIANTNVETIEFVNDIKEELYNHSFGPVKWVEIMTKLKNEGVTIFYEIGPGKVLKGLARRIDKDLKVINIEKLEDIESL